MNRSAFALYIGLLSFSLVFVSACGTPSASGPADTYGLDFTLPKGSTCDGAIIFLVDGVNGDVFNEMLQKGELPAIKKYFVDRGLYCRQAVASCPSVTLANLTSVVTGRFPGNHGITGINWFDRNQLIWRNYDSIAQKNLLDCDYTSPTIYEQFPQRTTISIFYQPHRNSTYFIENWMSAGPPYFFGWYEFVDRLTLYRLNLVSEIAKQRHEFPAITTVYMLSPDFVAYRQGSHSPAYREAIRHSDRQIGRVLGDLERAGLLDKLVIALVSDHSHTPIYKHFSMAQFLSSEGMKLPRQRLWENKGFMDRLKYYQTHSTVLYGSGDRYWAINLRKPIRSNGNVIGFEPWPLRPGPADLANYPTLPVQRRPHRLESETMLEHAQLTCNVDLPALLARQEAVDVVAYSTGDDRVRIRRCSGEVEFTQIQGRISYKLISGSDPLQWQGKVPAQFLAGQPATGRQWLEATHDTSYPDLPAQIVAYFRARRAGDIAVFAAPGWDFDTLNRSGHGGLRPVDMFVPLLIAGPGVPKGHTVHSARTVDLMPTVLTLMNRNVPPGLDGTSLVVQPGK